MVERKALDTDDQSPLTYGYETVLWRMVGADAQRDSMDRVRPRIQELWNSHHNEFRCTTTGLYKGNILRYAVLKNFLDLHDDFVRNYGLDINFVDPADGMNLYDWLCARLPSLSGRQADEYANYRKQLEALGARPSSGHARC